MKKQMCCITAMTIAMCLVISCLGPAMTVEASGKSESKYLVTEGADYSEILLDETGRQSFGIRSIPEIAGNVYDESIYVGDPFPNGLRRYELYNPDGDSMFGLLSYDGKLILQPEYRKIYMLNRCRGSVGILMGSEVLPNILILIDEEYRFRVLRCTGETPELMDGAYDLIGATDWISVSSYSPDRRAERIASRNVFYENFIPVYCEGQGYGLISFDGELIVPCRYDRYSIVESTRIAMYYRDDSGKNFCDVYGVDGGDPIFSGNFELYEYSEGLAGAELDDGRFRYFSMDGSSAFTLREHQDCGYTPAMFSDGLIKIRAWEEHIGSSYIAYLDKDGNEIFSMRDIEKAQDIRIDSATDFYNGVAYATDNMRNKYVISAEGGVIPLRYKNYLSIYNGYQLVDTNQDGQFDNVCNKWGSRMFAELYEVRRCENIVAIPGGCHWVAVTDPSSKLTSYFNLDTGYRTGFHYTDKESIVVKLCNGHQYLRVCRDGKYGVLGENAKEVIPAEYDSITMPEGNRNYFIAKKNSVYSITLYDADGTILGVPDQYEFGIGTNSPDSGYDYLYSYEHRCFVIITPSGESVVPQENSYICEHSGFNTDVAPAEYISLDDIQGFTHYYGYLTGEGEFLYLVDAENNTLFSSFDNNWMSMAYGSCESREYILYQKGWTPGAFLTADRPVWEPVVSLVKSFPADGQNYISRNTDVISLEFNQDIILQEPAEIRLSCDLGDMDFRASVEGHKLKLYPAKNFYTGEIYTLHIGGSALSAANSGSQISIFDGVELQFKITGISSNTLLSYYPSYLERPDCINDIFTNANLAVDKMMETYCGRYGEGEAISSFFYAAKNLDQLTVDSMKKMFGGDGTQERLQNNLLNQFISKACMDVAVTMDDAQYAQIERFINFCRGWDIAQHGQTLMKSIQTGLFKTAADQQGILIDLTKSLTGLNIRDFVTVFKFCSDHADSLEKAWNSQQSMQELRDKTMDDLLGEYSMTLLTYVYMNRAAIQSLLNTLSADSDLYRGLQERLEALSGDALSEYLQEQINDAVFSLFVSKTADLIYKVVGKGAFKKLNFCIDMAEDLYLKMTQKADADAYIQVIMMKGYASSVSAAANNALSKMLISVNKDGQTTEEQRNDFRVAVDVQQKAYALLMEMAAELVDDPFLSSECLAWMAEINNKCGFAEYLEFCKRNAGELADSSSEIFPKMKLKSLWPETIYMPSGHPESTLLIDNTSDIDNKDLNALKSVIFAGDGKIKEESFAGCSALSSVLLGNVTEIGSKAFEGCAIKTILIPKTVTYIAEDAFADNPLMQVSGTTEYAHEFADLIGAEYIDYNDVDHITMLRVGYDANGRMLFVNADENLNPNIETETEKIFFLDPDVLTPQFVSIQLK